jgi:hypothetical protein
MKLETLKQTASESMFLARRRDNSSAELLIIPGQYELLDGRCQQNSRFRFMQLRR